MGVGRGLAGLARSNWGQSHLWPVFHSVVGVTDVSALFHVQQRAVSVRQALFHVEQIIEPAGCNSGGYSRLSKSTHRHRELSSCVRDCSLSRGSGACCARRQRANVAAAANFGRLKVITASVRCPVRRLQRRLIIQQRCATVLHSLIISRVSAEDVHTEFFGAGLH